MTLVKIWQAELFRIGGPVVGASDRNRRAKFYELTPPGRAREFDKQERGWAIQPSEPNGSVR